MKLTLRGASGTALLLGLAGGLQPALAQQTTTPASPQNQTVTTAQQPAQTPTATAQTPAQVETPAEEPADNRVVVTGSLIAGAAEDAPKPVEVFDREALQEQGSPTVTEFVRSLTASFGTGFGQAAPDSNAQGMTNIDLRGIGGSGTLVLMNGRRMASGNANFGADVNSVPTAALESVEVLKDGASTTYGAGAVGGVVNFRTRRDIDAPIVSIERSLYDGSEGDYQIDLQNGWVGDAGNILISATYSHNGALLATERDFSNLPYKINPTSWNLIATNPGRFLATNTPFLTGTTASTFGAVINDLPGNTGAAATAACQAIGGDIVANVTGGPTSTTANTACGQPQAIYTNLVNDTDNYRVYSEANFDITDSLAFHTEFTYSKTQVNDISAPINASTNRATDDGIASTCATNGCRYVIPVQVNTYNQVNPSTAGVETGLVTRNPFIDDFMARTGVTSTQLPDAAALYATTQWRPFGFGGNPYFPSGVRNGNETRERIVFTTSMTGEFTGDSLFGKLLNGVKYDFSGLYNNYNDTTTRPDIIAARLQNALLGYGGANCLANDLVPTVGISVVRNQFPVGAAGDAQFAAANALAAAQYNRTVGIQSNIRPGTQGCEWFNPFASGWGPSIFNGAANPQYNAGAPVLPAGSTARPQGYSNSFDLIDWMYQDKVLEGRRESGTFDATLSGQLPEAISLPGGQIGWAAGSQWRVTEFRNTASTGLTPQARTLNDQLCPYPDPAVTSAPTQASQAPGTRACTGQGAFFATGQIAESDNSSQTIAYYVEGQFPVLDNLNASASARRESYNGGDIVGDIWSLAFKYDILDNLFVRASYGTNFRTEGALDNRPGTVERGTAQPTRFGTTALIDTFATVSPDLAPESDTTFNAGIGWNVDIGEGRLRLGADYFEIKLNQEVATTPTANIFNSVFGQNSIAATTTDSQTNRTNPLIPDGQAGAPAGTVGTNDSLTQYADCEAGLVFLVQFNTPCTTGVTTAANLTSVITVTINGPGRTVKGIDWSADFSYPVLDGMLGVSLAATQNLDWTTNEYSVNGALIQRQQDRLGYTNLSGGASITPEWKANGTIRWANDQHALSLRANFVSGVQDERDPDFDVAQTIYPGAGDPTDVDGSTGVAYSSYGMKPKDYLDFDFTYIWTAPFWKELEFRGSVLNIADKNPGPQQTRTGYMIGYGNPRGRVIELAVTKQF